MASIRDSASLDDRYRAAPATRSSSRPACNPGSVVAVAVTMRPMTTVSSPSVGIGLPGSGAAFSPRRHRNLRFQLQEVLLADAADVHQLLDLFVEDSWRNFFNDLEKCAHQVRPPLTQIKGC